MSEEFLIYNNDPNILVLNKISMAKLLYIKNEVCSMRMTVSEMEEYKLNDYFDYVAFLEKKCYGIKHSLSRITKDTGHLKVRCPVSGEYIDVFGTEDELNWLDEMLERKELYRTTQ